MRGRRGGRRRPARAASPSSPGDDSGPKKRDDLDPLVRHFHIRPNSTNTFEIIRQSSRRFICELLLVNTTFDKEALAENIMLVEIPALVGKSQSDRCARRIEMVISPDSASHSLDA